MSQRLLRTQSAIVHIATEFLQDINKECVTHDGKKEYTEVVQWKIMGKSKSEIKDMIEMLALLVPFITQTCIVMANEITEREEYE